MTAIFWIMLPSGYWNWIAVMVFPGKGITVPGWNKKKTALLLDV
jgi:hypothetical protein